MEYGTPGLIVIALPSFFVNTGFDMAVHAITTTFALPTATHLFNYSETDASR